jgi:predicted  nucleic acid-binding Zn-ribbon protein
MTDIKENVRILVALQEKDCALDAMRSKVNEIPAAVEEAKGSLAEARAGFDAKKSALTQLQMKRKEKEIELDGKENQIKKHSMELNSVKSNDAYKALLAEIDVCKNDKSALESEILELMERIENEAVQIKEEEKKLKQKEAEVQATISRIEAERKEFADKVAALEKERNEFAETVPKDILSRYEYIREGRGGVAIVPIEGHDCGGCHTVLRAQVINDVCKAHDMIFCDNCSRILYKK